MTIGTTDYFGFTIVKDEAPSANDWAATYWNWKRLDGALYKAVTEHKHDGAGATGNPVGTLDLSSVNTGGSLLSRTYYVCVTYIDSAGLETAKSTTATIVINESLAAPSAPVLVTTGAHTGGLTDTSYSYKLAYAKGSGETTASSPLTVSLPGTQETEITFSFTSITAAANDADKIIIYRRSGNSGSYVKLAEITNTATTSYTDDNTGVPTCDKGPVTYNTTGGENVMTIDWSDLDIENAEAVRIYVSTTNTWTGATLFLAEVDLTVATPPSSYEWDGSPVLSTGKPPVITQALSNPSKIDLTSEVTGILSEANLPENIGGIQFIELPDDLFPDLARNGLSDIEDYLPANPETGDIIAVVMTNPTWGIEYWNRGVILLIWRGDWATPTWQVLNSALPIKPDGAGYANSTAFAGNFWPIKSGDSWYLQIMQDNASPASIRPFSVGNLCYYGAVFTDYNADPTEAIEYGWSYAGSHAGDIWEPVVQYMYGNTSFYWWQDSVEATPPPEGGEWVKRPQDFFRGTFTDSTDLPAVYVEDGDIAYCRTGADKGWWVYDTDTWVKQ
jgi:hypothetical protein